MQYTVFLAIRNATTAPAIVRDGFVWDRIAGYDARFVRADSEREAMVRALDAAERESERRGRAATYRR